MECESRREDVYMSSAKRRGRRYWCRIIDRYEENKDRMTLKDFTESEGINHWTFKEKLYSIRKERRLRKIPDAEERVRMVPVKLSPEVYGNGFADLLPRNWLEAEMPDGVKVRFCEGTSCEYVSGLVNGLRVKASC
jgi:hypothetical protein